MSTVRVYVNGAPVDVADPSTALDCVRVWNPAEADAVASGRRLITDSRGLPAPPDAPAFAGAIYRLVSNRGGSPGDG